MKPTANNFPATIWSHLNNASAVTSLTFPFSSRMSGKKGGTPKKKGEGVKLFDLYPKNYIAPYRCITEPLSAVTAVDRLQSFNNEFFTRPEVAMSEFATGLFEHLEKLDSEPPAMMDQTQFQKLYSLIMPLKKRFAAQRRSQRRRLRRRKI